MTKLKTCDAFFSFGLLSIIDTGIYIAGVAYRVWYLYSWCGLEGSGFTLQIKLSSITENMLWEGLGIHPHPPN